MKIILAALLALFATLPAFADTVSFSFAGCTDALNRPVASRADPALGSLVEVQLAEGTREIVYNPQSLPQLLPETRAFFYAHACAVVRLGQAIDRPRSEADVQRADCWAFDTLHRSGLLKREGAVDALTSDVELTPALWEKVPGPARALDPARCAGATPRPAAATRGNALQVAPGSRNASPAWNACTLACGNRLYACGRGGACQSAFDRCTAGCAGK
ncbi:MAG: hypothetical protein REI09_05660 [Candidatus Dactylopiibacterium sp.]|nr:hypothetical protein [Candidatus Dactylopiibacterium sp.]